VNAGVRLTELPGSIGTEVTGLDLLGAVTSADDIDALRDALVSRHLLLLRGEIVSGPTHTGFVGRFGRLVPERQLWGYVSNVRPDGIVREGALLFHSDFAFTRAPVRHISLHALEVPGDGAPTRFADATRAARMLPFDLRARLAGRRIVNVYDFHRPDDQPMRIADADPRSPRCEHAVLAPHPTSGVEVVMANELHTDHIVGVPRSESDDLLAELFAVLYADDNVLEHRWQVGDLIIWDNIALHHGRRDIPKHEPRTLQRVTLGDYTPWELVPDLDELLASR
jgi:taurine dioxygenase